MKKYLLDTHVALWLFNEYEHLPQKIKALINDESNLLYVSMISAWEVAIKNSIGKLPEFDGGVALFLNAIENNPIELITVFPNHVEAVEKLPFIHRDPFDRLLVATAVTEHMAILTADENIQKYDVSWIW